MNKHTIKNINLLSNCEKFSEKFAEITVSLLLNYNQIEFHSNFQNMIIFMTFLELLQQITLSIKTTNSSAQFSQEIIQMLNFNISHNTEVFINDIDVKKSKTKYDNDENFSEIHHFILEYLQMLNCVFLILKLTNIKISEEKSYFDQSEIVIIKYSCNYKRRHSETAKISKIMN